MSPSVQQTFTPITSPFQRTYRLVAFAVGFCMMIWLSFEDTNERWVIVFALLSAALITAYLLEKYQERLISWWLYTLFGCLGGILVTLAAILLMSIKTGLHSHSSPEFTLEQFTSVILRTPVWMLVGLLFGTAVGILKRGK
jgi:glucose-6-phosphate-specific signal transduction histidine kinase